VERNLRTYTGGEELPANPELKPKVEGALEEPIKGGYS
jgi:hypothetical protein